MLHTWHYAPPPSPPPSAFKTESTVAASNGSGVPLHTVTATSSPAVNVSITRSTLMHNRATGSGGALFLQVVRLG